jgi:hypothetical protein
MMVESKTETTAEIVEVIKTTYPRGTGVSPSPFRVVTGYFHKDGTLISEEDPCAYTDNQVANAQADPAKEREQIVAWLHNVVGPKSRDIAIDWIADRIERGEHWEDAE